METKKSMVLLFCFDKLLTERKLYKKTIEDKFGLSQAAFGRYKKDVRSYLRAYRPGLELKYSRSYGIYYLSKKE